MSEPEPPVRVVNLRAHGEYADTQHVGYLLSLESAGELLDDRGLSVSDGFPARLPGYWPRQWLLEEADGGSSAHDRTSGTAARYKSIRALMPARVSA